MITDYQILNACEARKRSRNCPEKRLRKIQVHAFGKNARTRLS